MAVVYKIQEDIEKGSLVKDTVDTSKELVKNVYKGVKESSAVVRFGLDTAEFFYGPVINLGLKVVDPLAEGAISRVDKTLTWSYKQAKAVYEDLDEDKDGYISLSEIRSGIYRGLVVPAKWFTEVDQILKAGYISGKVDEFKNAAVAAMDKVQSLPEFMQSLKHRMGERWNKNLADPARDFYSKAKKALDLNEDGIVDLSELMTGVVSQFEKRLRRPALQLYQETLEHFVDNFDQNNDQKVSLSEFIEGMQYKVGSAWDAKLVAPLTEFFHNASQAAFTDLKSMKAALDFDNDGKLTLMDFIQSGAHSLEMVVNTIDRTKKSILKTSLGLVDKYVPDEECVIDPNALSVKLVTKVVSKRLVKKAFTGLTALRKRTKELVHFDLIEFAETKLKEVQDLPIAQATSATVIDNYTKATQRLGNAIQDVKAFITPKVDYLKKEVEEKVLEPLAPYYAVLSEKLKEAVVRAKILAEAGKNYVLYREISSFPQDMYTIVAMTLGIKAKDVNYLEAEGLIKELLSALFEVIYWKNFTEISAEI